MKGRRRRNLFAPRKVSASLTLYPARILKIVVLFTLLALLGLAASQRELRFLARDLFIAKYADVMAGPDVPFGALATGKAGDAQYTREAPIWPGFTYGISTNSMWFVEQATLVVPYFASEYLTPRPLYPNAAYFLPLPANRSFVVGGSASCERGMVLLNERVLLDERWNDARYALEVFVHEMIHVQGGAFCSGTSRELESATSAATTEILAAMCNWGNSLSCKAFWSNIKDHAVRSAFWRANKLGGGWLFERWMDVFIRDASERRGGAKTYRFWAPARAERMEIALKYGLVPWEKLVLAGVRGIPLNTGFPVSEYSRPGHPPIVKILGMPMDDTRVLLGPLALLAWLP